MEWTHLTIVNEILKPEIRLKPFVRYHSIKFYNSRFIIHFLLIDFPEPNTNLNDFYTVPEVSNRNTFILV